MGRIVSIIGQLLMVPARAAMLRLLTVFDPRPFSIDTDTSNPAARLL